MACVKTDDLRTRLVERKPTDGWRGVLAIVGVFALATFLRMFRLGHPHGIIFDETYYVKEGASMFRAGVELVKKEGLDKPDPLFVKGDLNIWGHGPEFVVHPPLGKWVIGAGEWLFGWGNSTGWRFSNAVMGSLMVLMVGLLARRMFGSTLLGVVAALLLCFENHELVQSRTGLLDLGVAFWCLAAFCAIVADRYRTREQVAARAGSAGRAGRRERGLLGPSFGPRPWRFVAAVLLGIGICTKWSAGFYFVALGLLTVVWDMGLLRSLGHRRWFLAGVLRNVWTGIWMTLVVGATYVAGWAGWFYSTLGWGRDWAATNPGPSGFGWAPDVVRSFVHTHIEMYNAARNIRSKHDYMSNPWSWLVQGRPTSFWWEAPKNGQKGCTADSCAQAITSLGTPTLWWFATGALVVVVFMWAARRDWRAGAILVGVGAGYLPWFAYQDRTIFTFYAVVFVPYLVLAATYVLGLVLGRADATPTRRAVGLTVVGAFLAVDIACFLFFYPVSTAMTIPYHDWQIRMWLPSWI